MNGRKERVCMLKDCVKTICIAEIRPLLRLQKGSMAASCAMEPFYV